MMITMDAYVSNKNYSKTTCEYGDVIGADQPFAEPQATMGKNESSYVEMIWKLLIYVQHILNS